MSARLNQRRGVLLQAWGGAASWHRRLDVRGRHSRREDGRLSCLSRCCAASRCCDRLTAWTPGWLHLEGSFVCSSRRHQGKLRRPGQGQLVSGKQEEEGLLMRLSLSCRQHCGRGAQCHAERHYRDPRLPRKRSRGASN